MLYAALNTQLPSHSTVQTTSHFIRSTQYKLQTLAVAKSVKLRIFSEALCAKASHFSNSVEHKPQTLSKYKTSHISSSAKQLLHTLALVLNSFQTFYVCSLTQTAQTVWKRTKCKTSEDLHHARLCILNIPINCQRLRVENNEQTHQKLNQKTNQKKHHQQKTKQ